jgi:hypothetical protein
MSTLPVRSATISRKTNETDIQVSLTLDSDPSVATQVIQVSTGIGFLDHVSLHIYIFCIDPFTKFFWDRCFMHLLNMEECPWHCPAKEISGLTTIIQQIEYFLVLISDIYLISRFGVNTRLRPCPWKRIQASLGRSSRHQTVRNRICAIRRSEFEGLRVAIAT